MLVAITIMYVLLHIGFISMSSVGRHTNQACSPEMNRIYAYISDNIPADDIVAFRKPRVLRLFTGVNSVNIYFEDLNNSVADHFLGAGTNSLPDSLDLRIRFQTEHYMLISKRQ